MIIDKRSSRWEFKDIGKKFGRLTAVKDLGTFWISGVKRRKIECVCDCGNTHIATLAHLKLGNVKSCGCLMDENREKAWVNNTKHNLINHRLYKTWSSIQQRCYNPKHASYRNYGGRGIIMCNEWRYDFAAFFDWAMGNGCSKGLQIDRIDNSGNYEPTNCRFVSVRENNRNKRTNVNISFNGQTKCLSDWAASIGLSFKGLKHRIFIKKLPLDKALTPKSIQYDK